jgi:hypothetical protein
VKNWVVVQDLSPFGLNLESRHATYLGAKMKANGSRYLEAMSRDEARERERNMIEMAGALYGFPVEDELKDLATKW